jgi:hypothetical protein
MSACNILVGYVFGVGHSECREGGGINKESGFKDVK